MGKIYNYNDDIFEKIDTPEKAYWLGFLYADGSNIITTNKVKKSQWRVSLLLQKKDWKHVEKFKDFICKDTRKLLKFRKDGAARVSIFNKKISQDLCKLGVFPRKSLVIKFPEISILPDLFLIYFIQGLFDGDGSVSLTKKTKTPCACLDFTGSINLIKRLKEVIENKTGIKFGYKERTNLNTIAVIYIKGNDVVLKFLNWLYNDSTYVLERKYQTYHQIKKVKAMIISKKSSKYRGVYFRRGYPHSCVESNGKVYRLGRFKTELEAAMAYNTKAKELFGKKAKINVLD